MDFVDDLDDLELFVEENSKDLDNTAGSRTENFEERIYRCFISSPTPTELSTSSAVIKPGQSSSLPKNLTGRVRKKKKKAPSMPLNLEYDRVSSSVRNSLCKPSHQELDALRTLKDSYARLTRFRDHYFDYFPIERAPLRNQDVAKVVNALLEKIFHLREIFKVRNRPWFYAYRTLCICVDTLRSEEAFTELQESVKQLSHFPPLWIALGEAFWERNDYYSAVSCFEKAAILDRTSILPVLKISCTMRLLLQHEKDHTAKCKMLLKMVKLARDAVTRSPENGETWYNLGNALLVFFSVKAQPRLVAESLNAFKKAAECRVLTGQAEFHYNYGTANLLNGNYQEALSMWEKASVLEPAWMDPTIKLNDLLKYLVFIRDLVSGKDRNFRRRVKQLADSVPVKNLNCLLNDEGCLAYKISAIRDLKLGRNPDVVVHGKIYSTSYQTPDPSRLIFLIDSSSEAVPVIIYNMGVEFSVGGSVSVQDPVVHKVEVQHRSQSISFRYIRVDEPWKMFHNLIKVPRSSCASTIVLTTVPQKIA